MGRFSLVDKVLLNAELLVFLNKSDRVFSAIKTHLYTESNTNHAHVFYSLPSYHQNCHTGYRQNCQTTSADVSHYGKTTSPDEFDI